MAGTLLPACARAAAALAAAAQAPRGPAPIDLRGAARGAPLPALAGWLLQYPVVLVPADADPDGGGGGNCLGGHPLLLFRLALGAAGAADPGGGARWFWGPHHVLSFSVPEALLSAPPADALLVEDASRCAREAQPFVRKLLDDIRARVASQCPKRAFDRCLRWARNCKRVAVFVKVDRRIKHRPIASVRIIKTGGTRCCWIARPVPCGEIILQTARAEIAVEITVPFELPTLCFQIDADACGWRKRAPDMCAI